MYSPEGNAITPVRGKVGDREALQIHLCQMKVDILVVQMYSPEGNAITPVRDKVGDREALQLRLYQNLSGHSSGADVLA